MFAALNELLDADPFVPFFIVMNSGHRYEVQNPGMVVPERDILNLYRSRSNRRDVILPAEISSIEVHDPDVSF
jgi:hypothetical protein